jgi:hypothetical protein
MDLSHSIDKLSRHNNLKIGTIVAVRYIDTKEGLQASQVQNSEGSQGSAYETVYDVKIDDMMYKPFMYSGCRVLKSFFGPNNYYEVIHESADLSPTYTERTLYAQQPESLAGARCVLLFLEGEATAPVILGFLNHPARKSKVTNDKGVHLGFEFNGINVTIDKDGAFTLLASGPLLPPASAIGVPLPELDIRKDPINGPLTIAIDSQFNFSLTDVIGQMISVTHDSPLTGIIEVGNGSDSISIEKAVAGGTISIISSKSLSESCMDYVLDASLSADITTKTLKIGADVSTEITTKTFKLDSSVSAEIKTAQMKINCQATFALETATMSFKGAAGELLSILNDIFTGIGSCTVASPVGPCAPMQGAPQWAAQVQLALVKLKALMG